MLTLQHVHSLVHP